MSRTGRWLFAIYISAFVAVLGGFSAFLLWDRAQWQEKQHQPQLKRRNTDEGFLKSCVGCRIFGINQYPSDPVQRTNTLINKSEDMRQIGEFWRQFWFTDMPSHLTPERIHGGIM